MVGDVGLAAVGPNSQGEKNRMTPKKQVHDVAGLDRGDAPRLAATRVMIW
jgi:hypothetical protein